MVVGRQFGVLPCGLLGYDSVDEEQEMRLVIHGGLVSLKGGGLGSSKFERWWVPTF